MKITNEDLQSMLKMFTPKEILNKYINGGARLTSKQLEYLIKLKNEEVGNE